jgi:hypothetical protein
MNQCLDILSVSLVLTRIYPPLRFYTKRSTHGLWYIPDRPPDGYLLLPQAGKDTPPVGQPNHPPRKLDSYYLDLLPVQNQWKELRDRFNGYNDLFVSHVLQDDHIDLPSLLLICRSEALERKAISQMNRLFEDTYYKFECFITTLDHVKALPSGDHNIWTDVKEPGELYALDTLPEFDYVNPEDVPRATP